ncbi:hypothetical protein C4D60_Mb11t06110 [Musa balbisiana]|uniref:Uncharacterized protein n=1 Tax=Musa balbisiana TaxID=52838 RepID=A0A4V6T495_MUSBA|nr:hypothetical protein C4D60_Mb11t06110 [Musa balbisiana]
MPQSKRLLAAGGGGRRSSGGGFRPPFLLLLFLFVLAPSLFFAARGSIRAAPISPEYKLERTVPVDCLWNMCSLIAGFTSFGFS